MRTSLSMRAVAASAAAALFLSLGLEAALARGQASFRAPVMRPGFVHGHDRTLGWRNSGRQSWTWRSQNRLNRNRWFWNQGGFYGSGFWFSPYAFADTAGGVGGGVPLIVVGAPSFNDFPAADESADSRSEGGCVLHKLTYDSAGNYLGERQTPHC
jgi:hypothetical protein